MSQEKISRTFKEVRFIPIHQHFNLGVNFSKIYRHTKRGGLFGMNKSKSHLTENSKNYSGNSMHYSY